MNNRILILFIFGWLLTGCFQGDGSVQLGPAQMPAQMPGIWWKSRKTPTPTPTPTSSPTPSPTPSPSPSPAPSPSPSSTSTQVLIFNGTGTSPTDTQALVGIVGSHGLSYRVVVSSELESMTLDQLTRYKLILWPGGDSNVMSANLSGATRNRIRDAVRIYGVNYVGFCAGAWMAVGPAPSSGNDPAWGLSIVTGNYLKEYFPNGTQPVAAMVQTSFADGSVRDLVWWGGPYLPSYSGSVIAKYPDGSAAMMEAQAGLGYVVLTGPHPEAPQNWRDGQGLVDKDGLDMDVAWGLIETAIYRTPMAVF